MATRGPDPTVRDSALKKAIKKAPSPVATSRDVAELVGLSRQRVHERLQRLHEEGEIERAEISGKAIVWWIPTD